MNPLRWDVLLVGFLLSLPVLALGLRGDLTAEEVTSRMLWCLGAGWGAVTLVRLAMTPRTMVPGPSATVSGAEPPAEDREPTPAS